MTENIVFWITVLGFLFGIAAWIVKAASNLTAAITKLTDGFKSLGDNFLAFKENAEEEHRETHKKLDEHESRIHSLEDWKKYKEGEI